MMSRTRTSMFLSALVLGILWISAPSVSLAETTPAEKALVKARAAMLARQYETAVTVLKDVLPRGGTGNDEVLFLLARAYDLSKAPEKALAVLGRLIDGHPKSPFRTKAYFAKADLCVRLDKMKDALEIYRDQARRVTSEKRRLEMAEVYLRFADEFFKPADEVKKPDYGKACIFFAKAIEMGLPLDREASVVLTFGEALVKLRRHRQARDLLAAWQKKHPDHRRSGEVSLALGWARLHLGDRLGARREFRDLERKPLSPDLSVKAAFGIAKTFGLPRPRTPVDLELGAKVLLDVVEKFPSHKEAPKAAYQVGASYYHLGKFTEARRRLLGFLSSPAAKPDVEEVPLAKELLGLCHARQLEFTKAIRVWRGFLSDHPAHGKWTEVQRRIIDAEYAIGATFYQAKKYDKARGAWEPFLEAHPLDKRCRAILLLYGKADHDRNRFEQAVTQWEKLVSKYPRTNEASEGLYLKGLTLEQDLGKFSEALAAYRKLNFGPFARQAAQRVATLERKKLGVKTERVFLTNQKPTLKVSVRNIEKLEFRAWTVDLEAYFRKMHTADGVQNLDVPLIEPNHTWTVKVDRYEPYREIERDLELPLKGAGVWAVNVTGADLEATTVVVRSDLALIIKSSRRNLLVFAQNVRTGRPVSGADVVVSDGRKVFLESKTGKDGVLLLEPDGLPSVSTLRILGAHGGSWASNTLNISRLPVAQGLSRKAFAFTDRPTYRPGDRVRVKAVIREVAKGAYAFTKGAKYEVRVLDARGGLVRSGQTALSAFGSLHWAFTLPRNAPLGRWRIAIAVKGRAPFTVPFKVLEYTVPKLDVTVSVDNAIVYRGETVKGLIKVKTFYGEAAKDLEVEVRLGNLPPKRTRTSARGEIPFAFDTREFGETQVVALRARVLTEGVTGSANVHIATTSFKTQVKTLRSVYLTGEGFEVTFLTQDMAGKGVSIPLNVNVTRVETRDGRTTEAPVQETQITTRGDKGEGRLSLTLTQGGRHRITARGKDRFGNMVEAQAEVFISGKDDEVRVRILSEHEEYSLGQRPHIDVVNRCGKTLGLLTFEGDRLFRYKVVRLKEGTNPIQVTMDDVLSPNFILSVSVMEKDKLHQASREFRVTRKLTVTVRALDETATPGKPARVEITTRDPSGKPVPAEIALAMVDKAYLALFPRPLPDPAKTFFTRRGQGCGTVSTNTFSHQAHTRAVLAALRAEEQRLKERSKLKAELRRLQDSLKDAPSRGPAKPAAKRSYRGSSYKARKGGRSGWAEEEAEDGAYDKKKESVSSLVEKGAWGGVAFGRHNRNAQLTLGKTLATIESIQAGSLETGYWNPNVKTGRNGRIVLEVPMPGTVTTWQFLAVGTTERLLIGAGEGSLTTRKPLVAEIKAPRSMVEGDQAVFRARVRNLTGEALDVKLVLMATQSSKKTVIGTRTVTVAANDAGQAEFPYRAVAGEFDLQLFADSPGGSDAALETVTVYPKGTEIRHGWGGSATMNRNVNIEIPEREFRSRTLAITVGASLSRDLLDIGSESPVRVCCFRPAVIFSAADRGLVALTQAAFLKQSGSRDPSAWQRRIARAESAAMELSTSQNRDGGFGWTPKGSSNLFATVQAVRFLSQARTAGIVFNPSLLSRGTAYLRSAFSRAKDNTAKAAALWALAGTNQAAFAYVNRLYRIRDSLSSWALSALTLTLVRMDRKEMGLETARTLEKKIRTDAPPQADVKQGSWLNRWVDSDRAEETALAVLALCRAYPGSARIEDLLDRLAGLRVGTVWPTGKATAAAAQAMLAFQTAVKSDREQCRLTLTVNGKTLRTFALDHASGSQTVLLAPGDYKAGKNAVAFKMEGTGRYAYRITFAGVTAEPDDSQRNRYVSVSKTLTPQPTRVEGKEVQPGFGTVDMETKARWVNKLGQLPEGRFGTAELRYSSRSGEGYLVLEDSLPGGAVIDENSLSGNYEHVEVHPGRILFFLRGGHYGRITYRFYGYLPGDYAVKAPRVWSAVEPSRLSTGETLSVKVLKAGAKSKDPFRPTPDEIWVRGKARYNAKDFARAAKDLTALFTGFKLREKIFGETAKMLLFCAVELNRGADIVKYFEVLKERQGSLEIPFDKTMIIAQAYTDLGEEELALQIYQGLLEASFLKEANIAADLEDQGRVVEAMDFTRDLLREYPDLPMLVSGRFSLTQSVYRLGESQNRAGGVSRARWISRAAAMLRRFLGDHPAHRLSDQAGFSLVKAYLDLKVADKAGELAQILVNVHTDSELLDDFHYMAALAFFRSREYSKALSHASTVERERFPGRDGSRIASPQRHLAIYIMGQIHHAKGEFSEAASYYEKVKDRFADARAALDQFKWKRLSMPEVTRYHTGDRVEVKVSHRNVSEVSLLVYPVDLMKLYLIRKNLEDVATINLAGIKAFHQEKKVLGKKAEYTDRTTSVALPVKKEGAYLIVAKGGGIEASGLVVLSDLTLEVQEDTGSGRIRVTVQNEKSKRFEEDAHVKVVGSVTRQFISGETDLRGVFKAGGLVGEATIIVKKKTSYAFFRGTATHQPAVAARRRRPGPSTPPMAGKQIAQQLELGDQEAAQELLEDALGRDNRALQGKNLAKFRNLTRTRQEGMKAKQAKR